MTMSSDEQREKGMSETTIITDADMNEMRMCADCLGYGRVDGQVCVCCHGSGRVLTYRTRVLREQRRKRMNEAAPALYEALKELLNFGVDFDDSRMDYVVAQVDRDAIRDARAALSLVDGPTTNEAQS